MNQNLVLFLIVVCILIGIYRVGYLVKNKSTWFTRTTPSTQSMGTVIILNGPSGSGKSSIQREFQTLMMESSSNKNADEQSLWIKLGIDTLFDKPMPDITLENMSFWQSPNPIRWVSTIHTTDQKPTITLFNGKQGEKVAYGMNSAIAAYAHSGCNSIVDYIAYKQAWIDDLQEKLHHVKTYWIKIEIPLEVLEERERTRGTSPVGHARSHYDTVYGDLTYDLTLDTSKLRSVDCAQKLKEFIENQQAT